MKFQALMLMTGLTLLSSCDDVASNRGSKPEAVRPPLSTDTTPLTIPSGMFRERATEILYYNSEAKSGNDTNGLYRLVPSMETDHEGTIGKTIAHRTELGRPVTECGLNLKSTINERIADCAKINTTKASWSGVKFGTSSEGRWDLVVLKELTADNTVELWMDRRTGMIWSDVQRSTNWCEASGNNQNEISDVLGVDCQKLNVKSVCVGKEILGLPGIRWRLPTRNDYLQADIDGLRFVLKKGNGAGFWTATLSSTSALRELAWVYNSEVGTLVAENLKLDKQSRCIGAPLK